MSSETARCPQTELPDVDEKGAPDETGEPRRRTDRLFMQLLAFGGCEATGPLVETLRAQPFESVLYQDANDPRGVALLTFHKDPSHFVETVRPVLLDEPFAPLTQKPELTMLGRTYTLGYEQDLDETLFERPRRHVLNPDWPWAIWYPLRRSGAFEQLDAQEKRNILMEHGKIGMAYGKANLAHDVRLACHGLDRNDSDFVIGLTGRELHPLSHTVQSMRSTTQTSMYLERLGPFFVGKAIWQSAR